MGTRGTIAVRIDGTTHSAYNHWDSYPSGLGEKMLAAAKVMLADRPVWEQRVRDMKPVPDRKPTEEEIKALEPFTDLGVSTGRTDDWYCLLRNTQGDILTTVKAGLYEPFPVGDEEWSYVIDFDADIFEVWDGPKRVRKFPFADLPDTLKGKRIPNYS